mmetsp:Transcript_13573/g.13318  ORF Transcript_13573/g.13318 Transcript_13573/m.13318 type:complete len:90 (-) Transcript_13573:323-592(-)
MQINPFLTAFIFYCAFKEKLKLTQFIGMVLMTTCITINCFSQNSTALNDFDQHVESILTPVCFVIATSILFCFSNWTNRYYPPLIDMKS